MADDYGRFDADPMVVKASCFPLRVDTIKTKTITGQLEELRAAPLVEFYGNEDRIYGQFLTWGKHQGSPRAKKSRFPSKSECVDNRGDNICEHLQTFVPVSRFPFPDIPSPVSRTTPLPPKGENVWFEKFWQAYPRHKSKATAERAFAKACTSEATLAMMLDALKRLAPEWASRPPDKIPYPATWLNARGWEDEVTIGIGSQIIAAPKDECGRCGYGRTLHLRLLDGPNKGKIMGHTHGVSKVCEEYQSC